MLENKVLIIDDEEEICWFLKKVLGKEDIFTEFVYNWSEAVKILQKEHFDVILLDFRLSDLNGFEVLEKLKNLNLLENTEVILMTAYGDFQTGVEALNRGCYDYIAKPFNVENLIFRVKKAIENVNLKKRVEMLSQNLRLGFEGIVGNSEKMQRIYNMIKKVADKDTIVLIERETGTGKELVARAIHKNSKRKENIFIPLNCGALSETLLESELFGYEKGAFTGASTRKYGILETAHNGTVFLDEINNASFNVQVKLLRFIETGELLRVGGNKIIYCDTRIIAATNEKLEDLVERRKFRHDLYHRFNVVRIPIPPLRDRAEDIPLLVDYFLDMYNKKFGKHVKIQKKAINYLTEYHWPGNVRELKNMLQSLVLLNDTGIIKPDDLPPHLLHDTNFHEKFSFKELKERVVANFEINYLKNILKRTNGNVSKSAKIAKLNRKNFINKLKYYNIDPSKFKLS